MLPTTITLVQNLLSTFSTLQLHLCRIFVMRHTFDIELRIYKLEVKFLQAYTYTYSSRLYRHRKKSTNNEIMYQLCLHKTASHIWTWRIYNDHIYRFTICNFWNEICFPSKTIPEISLARWYEVKSVYELLLVIILHSLANVNCMEIGNETNFYELKCKIRMKHIDKSVSILILGIIWYPLDILWLCLTTCVFIAIHGSCWW